jgi:hypothetical protein
VGDRWIFLVQPDEGVQQAIEQEVMAGDKDLLSLRTRLRVTDESVGVFDYSTALYSPEWNLVANGFNRYTPPLTYYRFSLFPGKSWRQATQVSNFGSGTSTELVAHGQVVGWEEIEVPAGKYRTLRIDLRIETSDPQDPARKFETLETHWYSPEVMRPVKVVSRTTGGEKPVGSTTELVGIRFAP